MLVHLATGEFDGVEMGVADDVSVAVNETEAPADSDAEGVAVDEVDVVSNAVGVHVGVGGM